MKKAIFALAAGTCLIALLIEAVKLGRVPAGQDMAKEPSRIETGDPTAFVEAKSRDPKRTLAARNPRPYRYDDRMSAADNEIDAALFSGDDAEFRRLSRERALSDPWDPAYDPPWLTEFRAKHGFTNEPRVIHERAPMSKEESEDLNRHLEKMREAVNWRPDGTGGAPPFDAPKKRKP